MGHLPEWSPEAALTVPVGDDEALARAAIELLKDEPRRLAIAKRAHARAIQENADWTVRRIVEIYKELAASSA